MFRIMRYINPANNINDILNHLYSNHLSTLPIVLVFGIATSVTAVHRLLPHAASSLLSMEKFQAPPSSEYLTSVINQVVDWVGAGEIG